jgi:site-specific DNA-methyltransferase (adenine-specific)
MDFVDTILEGDCLDWLRKMPNGCIDMLLTDPPYGMDFKSNKQNCDTRNGGSVKKDRAQYFDRIKNDEILPTEWLREAFRVLKEDTAAFIFCHWTKWGELEKAAREAGFDVKNMIVMNKSNHGMGDLTGSFAPKHELLMYCTKGRKVLDFSQGRLKDVWDVKVKYSGAKRLHPNEKPMDWLLPAIKVGSKAGDIVLDPFAGSGSTAIACMMDNRRFVCIEDDAQHYKTATERVEAFRGCWQ